MKFYKNTDLVRRQIVPIFRCLQNGEIQQQNTQIEEARKMHKLIFEHTDSHEDSRTDGHTGQKAIETEGSNGWL